MFYFSSEYLQQVSEVLMFLLLPSGDFHNKIFRYIARVSQQFYFMGMLCDVALVNRRMARLPPIINLFDSLYMLLKYLLRQPWV